MGFEGFIISVWNGINQLDDDYKKAIEKSVNAGIDMFMVSEEFRDFLKHLEDLVNEGRVSMARIDAAVRRILTVKHIYGLFERPRPAERYWSNHNSFGSKEHREVAREAVRKSMVLLKNQNGLLPLNKSKRVLVAGKNADNRGHQCGGFTVEWQGTSGNHAIIGGTSIWEGIQQEVPSAVLSADGSAADEGTFDAAIVVIGETPYAEGLVDIRADGSVAIGSGMERPGLELKPYAASMELANSHPEDLATIKRITAKGIPVIAVLISGRPLVINPELEASDAFVAAWLPGSEGQGVADVLFGDHGFTGRLSFSWPKDATQTLNKGDGQTGALFPYGFGFTYPSLNNLTHNTVVTHDCASLQHDCASLHLLIFQ